jgi:hypothetical protein
VFIGDEKWEGLQDVEGGGGGMWDFKGLIIDEDTILFRRMLI